MKNIITIIFAYRNRDLERVKISMDSLALQTKKNFQVQFVDYGSFDTYSEPVKKLINSYSFARYHYVAHPGLLWNKSKAFNYAIKNADTPYILTADVDLLFSPNSLESLEKLTSPSSFQLFDYGYLPKGITPQDLQTTPFESLKPTHYGDVNGVGLYSNVALEEVHGFDEFFHFYGSEDVDLYQRLVHAGYKKEHRKERLFLHQWHPRYPEANENNLTSVPRLKNALRINQQHYFRCREFSIVVPNLQEQWGNCFNKEDQEALRIPDLNFKITNLSSSVVHFLNEHLESFKGNIVAIEFKQATDYLSLKYRLKKLVGRKQQLYLNMKEVNDMILEKIIFKYRHHNYSYSIPKDSKVIYFTIDLR